MELDNPLCRRTGALLTEMRKAAGLSQAALGEIAGIHTNTISKIERGLCDPNILVIGRLLLSLGCGRLSISEDGISPGPTQAGFYSAPQANRLWEKPLERLQMDETKLARSHGLAIRNRRLSLGLSLKDTAHKAGIHHNTLWKFENGESALSLTNAIRLYLTLDIRQVGGLEFLSADESAT